MSEQEQPAFKVFNPETGKEYLIFANGRTEGFEDATCVVNRIPQVERNSTLEAAAQRIENLAGNRVYQAAWRSAAKMLRAMKY